jgi:hypothetical protein
MVSVCSAPLTLAEKTVPLAQSVSGVPFARKISAYVVPAELNGLADDVIRDDVVDRLPGAGKA